VHGVFVYDTVDTLMGHTFAADDVKVLSAAPDADRIAVRTSVSREGGSE